MQLIYFHVVTLQLNGYMEMLGINQDPRFKRVQNGIYLGDYKIWSERENDLRKELSVPYEAISLGHIGRFDYVKNHKFLINLFAEYVKVEFEAHLVLVGEGHLRTQIEKLVATIGLSDKVHFLGARSDVPEILMSLDVFILPSFFEGLGLVLVESQISGTPCVISDIVPKEVDMNMGMLRFISLKPNIDIGLTDTKCAKDIYSALE